MTSNDTIVDDGEFMRLAAPLRPELIAHCYRILGSFEDAEDVVQTVYVDAWRGYDRFEGRSSLRTWLYRIATRAAIKEAQRRERRPLPSDLADPAVWPSPSTADQGSVGDVPWLGPIPDAAFAQTSGDPAVSVVARESTRLAFVAALQHLPAQQRVVLLLREVLQWRAAEVADLLGISVAAVNSALQRARTRLPLIDDHVTEPDEQRQLELLDRYVAAFEAADIEGLAAVLTDDAKWEMPPEPLWFADRGSIVEFLGEKMAVLGGLTAVKTGANGQPAVAFYRRDRMGVGHAHQLHVLTVTPAGIAHVVAFHGSGLFESFGLATTIDAG